MKYHNCSLKTMKKFVDESFEDQFFFSFRFFYVRVKSRRGTEGPKTDGSRNREDWNTVGSLLRARGRSKDVEDECKSSLDAPIAVPGVNVQKLFPFVTHARDK
jgi:hypothetical protein